MEGVNVSECEIMVKGVWTIHKLYYVPHNYH